MLLLAHNRDVWLRRPSRIVWLRRSEQYWEMRCVDFSVPARSNLSYLVRLGGIYDPF